MTAPVGAYAPIPGAQYGTGTMQYADVYPTHAAVGGLTTQGLTLPGVADALTDAQSRALALGAGPAGLMGTPAGWLVAGILGLAALSWAIGKR